MIECLWCLLNLIHALKFNRHFLDDCASHIEAPAGRYEVDHGCISAKFFNLVGLNEYSDSHIECVADFEMASREVLCSDGQG